VALFPIFPPLLGRSHLKRQGPQAAKITLGLKEEDLSMKSQIVNVFSFSTEGLWLNYSTAIEAQKAATDSI
jgi:hypothetical protein